MSHTELKPGEGKWQLKIGILLCVLFLGIAISPFLSTLLLAAILVTGAMPIHNWILKKVKGRDMLASAITASIISVIFSAAFIAFFVVLSQEAVSTYQEFMVAIGEGKFNFHELVDKASSYLGVTSQEIITSITQAAQSFSTTLVSQSTDLLKSLVWLVLNFFLLMFTMFFFFKDGKKCVTIAEHIIPLHISYAHEIMLRFKQVSQAMMYGIFLTSILQGLLGGIGMALAGISNPIFWGTTMAILGILPVVGTGIVWIPAGFILIFNGHWFAGVGLLIWCTVLIAGVVDHFVKPLVISKYAKISALATFLVVLGGLIVFGLKGAIIAPMILAALVALLNLDRVAEGAQE